MPLRSPVGSLSRVSIVPAGNAANASSVGANTVNGPSPRSVCSSPAAFTAVTSVVKSPAATAVSTMSAAAGDGAAVAIGASVTVGATVETVVAGAVSAASSPQAAATKPSAVTTTMTRRVLA